MYAGCPDGMEYRNCSWNLSCSNITSYYKCDEIAACTSGCFCAGKTVLNNGICSSATLCSGKAYRYIDPTACNICNTWLSALPYMYARYPRANADISGIARMHVLQVIICNTSDTHTTKYYCSDSLGYKYVRISNSI